MTHLRQRLALMTHLLHIPICRQIPRLPPPSWMQRVRISTKEQFCVYSTSLYVFCRRFVGGGLHFRPSQSRSLGGKQVCSAISGEMIPL